MKTVLIAVLWGINAWYATNFAQEYLGTPGVGPVAALVAGALAFAMLTRRAESRRLASGGQPIQRPAA